MPSHLDNLWPLSFIITEIPSFQLALTDTVSEKVELKDIPSHLSSIFTCFELKNTIIHKIILQTLIVSFKSRVRKLRIIFSVLGEKCLLPSVLGDLCYWKWAFCQMLQLSFIKIDKINGLLVQCRARLLIFRKLFF